VALVCGAAWAAPKVVSLKTVPAEVTLGGAGATQQFVAIGRRLQTLVHDTPERSYCFGLVLKKILEEIQDR